jgi:ABC-type Fe3+/spermidine/putrescine transport system ATPase subunit
MEKITIEVNNLNKKYKNALAVKSMSFKINKGQTIGLLGPNGCGKSNLLFIISFCILFCFSRSKKKRYINQCW